MPEATSIRTADGERLEAEWHREGSPDRVTVFCHAHPLAGGTMRAPLQRKIVGGLSARGHAVLQFNFRGTGRSTGRHGDGVAELLDIDAAADLARHRYPHRPLGIAGWSFGAATSLVWTTQRNHDGPWVGIAPPIAGMPEPSSSMAAGPRTFIIGDRDQFTDFRDLRLYAEKIGGVVRLLEGSDHFFHFREEKVTSLADEGLRL